jgi:perosamine synthetase
MLYLLPPAGTPASPTDIIRIFKYRLFGQNKIRSFEEEIKSLVCAKYCYLFNSGRASLAVILQALSKITEKDEVVIPAYTCYSVAASAAKAGLRIRLVDIDPNTLDYNYDKLRAEDLSRVMAIVGCNLLGNISDWAKLKSISQKQGCFLIDDAAQSLGSLVDDSMSGMSGHAGIFSFGRGKNLSTEAGGAIVTSDKQIADSVEEINKTLPGPPAGSDWPIMAKIAVRNLVLNPRIYWFPAKLPFLEIGKTIFDPSFEIRKLSSAASCAGIVLIKNLEEFNVYRRRNAMRLAKALIRDKKYSIPGFDLSESNTYLRLPVVCADKRTRDKAIGNLRRLGISASTLYPSTIGQIPGIEKYLAGNNVDFPGAQIIVDRMLVLPTHPLVKEPDIDKMARCLVKGE